MIAIPIRRSARPQAPGWHAQFLSILPAIRRQATVAFRGLPPEAKEDAVCEVIDNALVAFVSLSARGKADLAYPTPLTRYGIAQYRAGRRVGNRSSTRDVYSPAAQRKHCLTVERLDHFDEDEQTWEEVLVEDHHATPADVAAMRIDFAAWLRRLPRRIRRIALHLAAGHRTRDTARTFKLSPARISQLRRWLRSDWETFQGQRPADDAGRPAAPARPSGRQAVRRRPAKGTGFRVANLKENVSKTPRRRSVDALETIRRGQ
jgi:hypothetical protein